jgi:hypothetical protein
MTGLGAQIMIRPAYADDERSVARLAALDSAPSSWRSSERTPSRLGRVGGCGGAGPS